MKRIINNIKNELYIKKSRFITTLIYIENEEQAEQELIKIKNEHKNATHNCFAFKVSNTKRFSDDGEPGGTAGMPILTVIENLNLTNVLCVVTRYFGGIKLGSGGLVRAYSKSAAEAIKKAKTRKLVEVIRVNIEFNYSSNNQVDYLLKKSEMINKEYKETITYKVIIDLKTYRKIEKELRSLSLALTEENLTLN